MSNDRMTVAQLKAEIASRLTGLAAEYFANTLEQDAYVIAAEQDGIEAVVAKIQHDASFDLMDYENGDYIRVATDDETRASLAAAEVDGGAGVIEVEGRRCYVI